jgi:hypothetical protein
MLHQWHCCLEKIIRGKENVVIGVGWASQVGQCEARKKDANGTAADPTDANDLENS